MSDYLLDDNHRFVVNNFSRKSPFSSFLPGIAGKFGIPLWIFYVNRGQAIASFGLQDKDSPIVEFQPANKAYRLTSYEGFRTFIKVNNRARTKLYEPFAPWSSADRSKMIIGMNELEIEAANPEKGLITSICYFLLPNEPAAALVRQVRIRNSGKEATDLEILDGLPILIPYGIGDRGLKDISRTLEAWMEVTDLEIGIPFFKMLASSSDTDEVSRIQSGHYYLSFDQNGQLLPVITDPGIVFGQNSDLHTPEIFANTPLEQIVGYSSPARGKTPCGFAAHRSRLEPGSQIQINSLIGHAPDPQLLEQLQTRMRTPGFLDEKRSEAVQLVEDITKVIFTESSSPEFDSYCRQTYLDNALRGGIPIILPETGQPHIVYHLYSRKHGDLERDYNHFQLAPEPYSQGNGNYRDINQNRRNDVFFEPNVGDFNIRMFINLIQADGYNPLVLLGSRFSITEKEVERLLGNEAFTPGIREVISKPFKLGDLWSAIDGPQIEPTNEKIYLFNSILGLVAQSIDTDFHEGYWIDHWVYNLDLIEDYLAVFPDRKFDLLFGEPGYTYYDNEYIVRPRNEKYVKKEDQIRQYGAIARDAEKAVLIGSREASPNLVRGDHGRGEIFHSTLYEKLTLTALLKFATMDPDGLGIEMEAGRPGWYDALNGLPGLLGSSLPETFELLRLLDFLQDELDQNPVSINFPEEASSLLSTTLALLYNYNQSSEPDRDYQYWDRVATARENYRSQVRLGFSGIVDNLTAEEVQEYLGRMINKIKSGITKALATDSKLLPTYFYYEVIDFEYLVDESGDRKVDASGRPFVRACSFNRHILPPFLEGPTKYLKVVEDIQKAEQIHSQIMASDLYDEPLGMFRVCCSLAEESHEIGRARAFTPGWLENESIWTHMSFKYLLALLEVGMYDEFFNHFRNALPPNMDPEVYGRSILENSSFIVSSAHPDKSLHGAGFIARLSGVAAEFLSIWRIMIAGKRPFRMKSGELELTLKPILPGWMFSDAGLLSSTFLGHTKITYCNPGRLDTFNSKVKVEKINIRMEGGSNNSISGDVLREPYAGMVRNGQVEEIEVYMKEIS